VGVDLRNRTTVELKLEGNSTQPGALSQSINSQGLKMPTETDAEMLKKSAATAADLAKDLRKSAERQTASIHAQHVTAHKLEDLSADLAKGAVDVKKN
jgi:hypothetical protein